MEKAKEGTEKLRRLSEKLMNDKKEFVTLCQTLVDAIKDEEKDIAAEGRKWNRETVEALDLEKKSFRAGHLERLRKFLHDKTEQEKESTGKALQPEFSRLQSMHESELAEVEAQAKRDERAIKEEFQNRLDILVREEREAHLESQRNASKLRSDTVKNELEASDREHRMRMLALHSDLERDLDKLRNMLSMKIEKEKRGGEGEVQQAQESFQQRVSGLRQRHKNEVNALMKDYDEQIKEIHAESDARHREKEMKLREEMNRELQLHKTNLDILTEDRDRDRDPVTGQRRTRSDDDEQGEDYRIREEVTEERDRRLQSEIRSLQAESIRLERQWKTKAEEERNRILTMKQKEEQESSRRQRILDSDAAQVSTTREALAQEVRLMSDKVTAVDKELGDVRKELDVYEGGISAHNNRLRDLKRVQSSRLRDEEMSAYSKTDALRRNIDKMNNVIESKRQALQRELKEMEQVHLQEMEKLDRQVRSSCCFISTRLSSYIQIHH